MAQFIETNCGEKALLYEGYKYLKICDGKDRMFWRSHGPRPWLGLNLATPLCWNVTIQRLYS